MANRYANLVGSNKIKDEYTKINAGFDAVQAEMDSVNAELDQKADRAFAQVNDLPADTKGDTLNIAGGTGITISTNPNTKTVTVTATGTATPGAHGSAHTEFGADPIPNATPTEGGLMSAADKAKLDKITPVFDVVWFGADPTGVTDSTTAIQAAVNAALENGGVVYFPAGNYYITDTINIVRESTDFFPDTYPQLYKTVAIKGGGNARIVFSGITAFELNYMKNITIDGLTFDGQQDPDSIAINLKTVLRVFIENNVFMFVQKGVVSEDINDSHEIVVRNNHLITKNFVGSVAIEFQSADNYAVGNIIHGFECGMKVSRGGHIITHNHFYEYPNLSSSNYCVYFMPGADFTMLTNNYFDSAMIASVCFDNVGGQGTFTISNNIFLHKQDVPFIQFKNRIDQFNVVITGNQFKGLGTTVTVPIEYPAGVANGSRRHFVQNNGFHNSNVVASSCHKKGTIPSGSSSVVITFSEIPSSIYSAVATGKGVPVYIQNISGNSVTVATQSPVASNTEVYVYAHGVMEHLSWS